MQRPNLLAPMSALLLAVTAAGPLPAQEPPEPHSSCMRAEELAWFLRREFEEVPTARGLSDGGVLVTVFAAKTAGTWTIAVTDPSGVSCIVATGTGFELTPEALSPGGEPAPT
jgi:hypothetical protein